jgi:phosphate starvation-inducible protein PhoH
MKYNNAQNYDTVTFLDFPKKPNKKHSKRVKKQQASAQQKGINLRAIFPITDNQEKAFESFSYNKNILLHGVAGTGKTFISLYLALKDALNTRQGNQSIQIIRSVVPTRDMGFLPGNQKEKSKAYEEPYYSICNELFDRGDAYDILKRKGILEFSTTSFIRGLTFNDTTVIVDECQNMTWHELDSVITRLGENSRIVFCGDFRQSDFLWNKDKSGIHDFMKVIKTMDSFDFIEFDQEDIVRSALVKEYIISKLELGMI